MAGARDYLWIALAVGGLFGVLWVLTGSWPPAVTVQSNSMMHVNVSEYQRGEGDVRAEGVGFGRMGTIDPGDLVLVDSVDDPDQIQTFASAGVQRYGAPGDALVFKRTGTATDLTVIHRAMTYVGVEGEGRNVTYTVEWTDAWDEPPEDLASCTREPTYVCTFDSRGVLLPELGVYECPDTSPPQSGGLGAPRCADPRPKPFLGPGFITKGDNEATNPVADQSPPRRGQEALNPQPVAMQQVEGVARGELPALGLLKVAFSGSEIHNADIQYHNYFVRVGNMVAPIDVWAVAFGELVVLSTAPLLITVGRQLWDARDEERVPELSVLQEAAERERPAATSNPEGR